MNQLPDEMILEDYRALTAQLGYVSLGHRTRIEMTGSDRATFLHNFCTNDITRLKPGEGCEAFLTSVKGKILAHIFVFCRDESLILDGVSGQGEVVMTHLDRYLIREDVQLCDASREFEGILLSGERWRERLAPELSTLPQHPMCHCQAHFAGNAVPIHCVDLTGAPCFLLSCAADVVQPVLVFLQALGGRRCDQSAWEIARVEAGVPVYSTDITDVNLPQEVGRNDRTISFTKGCYLGQETVARIDALGHVNRILVGVRYDGDQVPERDSELLANSQSVGRVTSAVYSPRLDAPLAMAYLRRGYDDVGTRLGSHLGDAEVVLLPLSY